MLWPERTSGFAVRPRSPGWSARRIQARLQAERRGRPVHPTLRTKRGPAWRGAGPEPSRGIKGRESHAGRLDHGQFSTRARIIAYCQ